MFNSPPRHWQTYPKSKAMNKKRTRPRVRVIAPGRDVRGGITAVIRTYESQELWKEYDCVWLETYCEESDFVTIGRFLRACLLFWWLVIGRKIVHIHVSQKGSLYRKAFFLAFSKILNKKVIVHLHAADFDAFEKRLAKAVSRRLFSSADVVIALSDRWKEFICKIAPEANVKVIHNPCSIPSDNSVKKTDGNIILFSGRLVARKGFSDLIKAMPIILRQVPDAKLFFAGHGNIDEGQKLARELGVLDNVKFLGWVTGREKEGLLNRTTVFCLPSYGEGVPMSMLEAMSFRIPVVVTPVGGILDVVKDGDNGILVDPGDIESVANGIIKLLDSKELQGTYSQRAFEMVRREFWPEVISEKLRAVYVELSKT